MGLEIDLCNESNISTAGFPASLLSSKLSSRAAIINSIRTESTMDYDIFF